MVSLNYLNLISSALVLSTKVNVEAASTPHENSTSGDDLFYSPHVYPSPQGGRTADEDWAYAYQRARSFVNDLSLAEKVNLTTGIYYNGLCVGQTGGLPAREDMWGLCLMDGPLAIRATDLNTGFPAPIAAGSTFNKELLLSRGKAMASEFKGKGADVYLGPTVGPIGLVATGGRNFESFGSDPYLQGVFGGLTVEGVQSMGVMATGKHFIGNEQELHRHHISSNINDRALHELYTWPFADLVKSGVGSVMCSYNLVNNSYACENSYTMNKVLKDEMGFQGFVMSDWLATHSGVNAITSGLDMNMPGDDFFGANLTAAVLNGTLPMDRLDDMSTRIMAAYYKTNLDKSRKERGKPNFSAWTVKDTDVLYQQSNYGPEVKVNYHVDVRTQENYDVAKQLALESIVLLKNENKTLPFKGKKKPKKVSVLGAAARVNKYGVNCDDRGCDQDAIFGATQLGWGSGATNYPYFIAPYDGFVERATKDWVTVDVNTDTDPTTDEFQLAATYSDINVIYALASAGEKVDRNNTDLWLNGDETIKAAAALHSNNVVVITSVGQVNMDQWINHENVTAVIFALPGGQDTGTVLAEVLFGDENPSGRLPFTIAKSEDDYFKPVNTPKASNGFYQDNQISEVDLLLDYRYFDAMNIEPLFEFGYGLSYSNFSLKSLEIHEVEKPSQNLPAPPPLNPAQRMDQKLPSAKELVFPHDMEYVPNFVYPYLNESSQADAHGKYPFPDEYSAVQKNTSSLAGGGSGGNPALWKTAYEVSVELTNNGPAHGKYVPQLYIGFPDSDEFPTPPRQLRGFEKPFLHPCQSTKVTFDLKTRDISVWDVKTASWIVLPGEYRLYVGSSSRNLELQGTITI